MDVDRLADLLGVSGAPPREPGNRSARAPVRQVHAPAPAVPGADRAVLRAEPDSRVLVRDHLVELAAEKLAPAEPGVRGRRVAVERDCRFVFRDGLLAAALGAQQLSLDV